ncbi:MAG TPA: AMP-binding protein [Azospira sp.]|nr:AMP-binding protein [Azospira sp.]
MNAATHPLTSHSLDAVIAYRPEGPVSTARFLADVARLVDSLPAGGHVLNVCQDRYRFMVGLAAALVAKRISLLPSTHTAETVRQLKALAPDVFCLHDGHSGDIDLPRLAYPEEDAAQPLASPAMPRIPAEQVVAYVFTSGSTGLPQPHVKTWGALVRNTQAGAKCLGMDQQSHSIVGTVPPQHMYGFESTVLLALHGGCACWAGRPFYPADIAAALAAVPAPRLLVTTPFHLRALLDAEVELSPVGQLLSATAPLSENLAREAEGRLFAPLYEIYGCTETGQIASRRTIEGATWHLLPDIRLEQEADVSYAQGGHVEGRVRLGDRLELCGDHSFLLHGRSGDLINIAGKRSSLGYLNHQLLAIPGVADGSFFMPQEEAADGVTRPCAFVVAPGLSPGQLLAALRQRLDPIFLPRPLVFLERLPRNAAGKLPQAELAALAAHHGVASETAGDPA